MKYFLYIFLDEVYYEHHLFNHTFQEGEKMQCSLCNKPLIVNAEESAPFSGGDFVTIPLSIPGIHQIFEIWERFVCKSCNTVHYKIKLVSSEENISLPGELICPEHRLTLENCSVR